MALNDSLNCRELVEPFDGLVKDWNSVWTNLRGVEIEQRVCLEGLVDLLDDLLDSRFRFLNHRFRFGLWFGSGSDYRHGDRLHDLGFGFASDLAQVNPQTYCAADSPSETISLGEGGSGECGRFEVRNNADPVGELDSGHDTDTSGWLEAFNFGSASVDVGDKEFPTANEQVGMSIGVAQLAVINVLVRDRESLITGPESKSVVEEFSKIHVKGGTVATVGLYSGYIIFPVETSVESSRGAYEPVCGSLILSGSHDRHGSGQENQEYSFHSHRQLMLKMQSESERTYAAEVEWIAGITLGGIFLIFLGRLQTVEIIGVGLSREICEYPKDI